MRPWLLEGRVFSFGKESEYLSIFTLCFMGMRPGLTYEANKLMMIVPRKKKQWC